MADVIELTTQVSQALQQLYYEDPQRKYEAQQWLMQLQQSEQAWNVAWYLLSDLSKEGVVHFFGAGILRHHIKQKWLMCGEEEKRFVLTKLFDQLKIHGRGVKMVRTQLSLVLVAIILHSDEQCWPNAVAGAVEMLNSSLRMSLGDKLCDSIALEVLTCLPEEFRSTDLPGVQRNAIRQQLRTAVPVVLQVLEPFLLESPEAVRCLTSWVGFGIPLSDLEPILNKALQSLDVAELFDDAVELFLELADTADGYRFPNTLRRLFVRVIELAPRFRLAVAHQDMYVCSSICRLAVALCESHTKVLLTWDTQEQMDMAKQFLDLVMACVCLPGFYPRDESCSGLTNFLWYQLQDEMQRLEGEKGEKIKSIMWDWCFARLLQVFVHKVQYPSNEEWSRWAPDEQDDFVSFRHETADTVMFVSCLYWPQCLAYMHSVLEQQSNETEMKWQVVEAVLLCLRVSADTAERLDSPAVVDIFSNFLPALPSRCPGALQAAFNMISAYSEWLNQNFEVLPLLMPLLFTGCQLTSPRMVGVSAMSALRDVCHDCSTHLVSYLPQLMAICEAQSVMAYPQGRVRLMESVCSVLSALPEHSLLEQLDVLLQPRIAALGQLTKQPAVSEIKEAVMTEVQLLNAICKCVSFDADDDDYRNQSHLQRHPLRTVFQETDVWPRLRELVNKWSLDAEIMQRVCSCLSSTVRNAHESLAYLLPDFVTALILWLEQSVHPCLIELAAQLVGVYASSCKADLVPLVINCSTITLKHLQLDGVNRAEIAEAFYKLLSRTFKSCPELLLVPQAGQSQQQVYGVVFEVLRPGLCFSEAAPVSAACSAFEACVVAASKAKHLNELWAACGPHLVCCIFEALLQIHSEYRVLFELSDLLFVLNKHCPAAVSSSVQVILDSLGPFSAISSAEKQKFKLAVLRERARKSSVRDAVQDFVTVCHNLPISVVT